MSAIVWWFEQSLALLFLEIGMKPAFSSPVATAEFSKCAGTLSAALSQHHLSGFNSSTGILSPPLALFVVMLSKADLNKISYDYTVEVRNRFKGLYRIEFLMNYGLRFVTLYRRQGSRPSQRKINAKKQNGCLRRPYK